MYMVLAALLMFACLGVALAIYRRTVVEAWVPGGIALALAALSGLGLRRRRTDFVWTRDKVMDLLLVIMLLASAILTLLYALNFMFSDPSSRRLERATVGRRYTEVHHRTKRVGRRHVGQGEPYDVYYVEIVFLGGQHKTQQITRSHFDRIQACDTIGLWMEDGLLGFPVIKGVATGHDTENH